MVISSVHVLRETLQRLSYPRILSCQDLRMFQPRKLQRVISIVRVSVLVGTAFARFVIPAVQGDASPYHTNARLRARASNIWSRTSRAFYTYKNRTVCIM